MTSGRGRAPGSGHVGCSLIARSSNRSLMCSVTRCFLHGPSWPCPWPLVLGGLLLRLGDLRGGLVLWSLDPPSVKDALQRGRALHGLAQRHCLSCSSFLFTRCWAPACWSSFPTWSLPPGLGPRPGPCLSSSWCFCCSANSSSSRTCHPAHYIPHRKAKVVL